MLQFAAIFLAQMTPLALAEEPYERAKPWRYEKYLGPLIEALGDAVEVRESESAIGERAEARRPKAR